MLFLLCVSYLPCAQAQSGYNWVKSIGRPGNGGYPFSDFCGVVSDALGNLYVSDWGNNTIEVLDPQGNFLFAFGSSSPSGALPGTFSRQNRIARDTAGYLYVADTNNNRIEKFDARGRFVMQFGSAGSGNGQLSGPVGVAVDGVGNLYVADAGNNRCQKFSPTGKFLLAFGNSGSGNGQLNDPQAVALDRSGNIYVADDHNNLVQKFSPTGGFLLAFGTTGSGNGQFNSPTDVVIDGTGNIYVADQGNNRVQKFSATGAFIGAAPINGGQVVGLSSTGDLYAGANNGTMVVIDPATMAVKFDINGMNPAYIAVDSRGNTYVGDYYNGRLMTFSPSGRLLHNFSIPSMAQGIAVDSAGNIFLADWANNQVLKYPAGGGAPRVIAGPGSGNGQVSAPCGIALDTRGNLYVADYNNDRVDKFSAQGTFLTAYGTPGSGNGQFNGAQSVFVDRSGNMYVADHENNRIQKLSATGQFLLQFGTGGSGNGQFHSLGDMAVDSSGNIYAADYGNNRVQKFSATGAFISVFPTPLNRPNGIRINNAGNILVTDFGNGRVVEFSTNSEVLGAFDAFGPNYAAFNHPLGLRVGRDEDLYVTSNTWAEKVTNTGSWLGNFGGFSGAAGLTLDSTGNIYIADLAGNDIQKFSSDLTFLSMFGSSGTGNGQFSGPTGVALDNSGNLYVTDSGNARVQKFNSSFTYAGQFGSSGIGKGQFLTPAGIVVDSTGDLLVTDYANTVSHVDVFGSDANFPYLGSFGGSGTHNGLFANPYDVNLDSTGNIYVADQGNARVQIFDPKSHFLYAVGGGYGGASGQLIYPDSVAVDSIGNVYIADSYTDRISEFAPIPLLATLTPLTAEAGSPALTLTASGSGFTPDAIVTFNAMPLTTQFASSTSLSATLPATRLTTAGTFPVAVVQMGGRSYPVNFTITPSGIPEITGINPVSVDQGSPTQTLTVQGVSFTSDATVKFNGAALSTKFVSTTQLTATLTATLLKVSGYFPITVAQSSGTSSAVGFAVNAPAPVVTDLSPLSAWVGSKATTLSVTGTGFTSDAVVSFGGTALPTTFVSPTQVTATIPATLLASAGVYPVVLTEASGSSEPVSFTINPLPPTVTGLSPNAVLRGSPATTLLVLGTDFTSDAVIRFKGTLLPTTFVSSTRLITTVPASLLTAPGFYPVVVKQVSGTSRTALFLVL